MYRIHYIIKFPVKYHILDCTISFSLIAITLITLSISINELNTIQICFIQIDDIFNVFHSEMIK